MAVEDYLEPEVAVTAVAVAAIFSPKTRKLIRRGAVYGLSSVLVAGDVLTSFGKSIGRGIQVASVAASQATASTTTPGAKAATASSEPATNNTDAKKRSSKSNTKAEQAEKEDQA